MNLWIDILFPALGIMGVPLRYIYYGVFFTLVPLKIRLNRDEKRLILLYFFFGILYVTIAQDLLDALNRIVRFILPLCFALLSRNYVRRSAYISLFYFIAGVTLLQILGIETGFNIAEILNPELEYIGNGYYNIGGRIYRIPPGLGLPVKNTYLLVGLFPFVFYKKYLRWPSYILLVFISYYNYQITLLLVVLLQPIFSKFVEWKRFRSYALILILSLSLLIFRLVLDIPSIDLERNEIFTYYFNNFRLDYFFTGWYNTYFDNGIDNLPHNLFLNSILIGGLVCFLLVVYFLWVLLNYGDSMRRLALFNLVLLMLTHNRSFLFADSTWLWLVIS